MRNHRFTLLLLFFFSGVAALMYQVIWVRQLSLLFGATAQAVAVTVAVFFAGLATGGWYWGTRSVRVRSGLHAFGALEVAVGAAALAHFALMPLYHAVYPTIFAAVGTNALLDTASRVAMAALVLFPASFLMGGTLPMMSRYLVRNADSLGRTASLLYAVNTAGSASGALVAGFVLPPLIGFRWAYLIAVAIDLTVGVSAMILSRTAGSRRPADVGSDPVLLPAPETTELAERSSAIPVWAIRLVAFGSGFSTLAVEVLWTRLFSQVLQNSVYTYAIVLTSFLLALATGSWIANRLCRIRRVAPETLLVVLLALASGATAASPWLFFRVTGGFAYLGGAHAWGGYVMAVVQAAILLVYLPGAVLGTILPFLFRTLGRSSLGPGGAIGRLIAADTVGAITGSLMAGFVLLPRLGAFRSLTAIAALYALVIAMVCSVVVWPQIRRAGPASAAAAGLRSRRSVSVAGAFVTLAAITASVALVRVEPLRDGAGRYGSGIGGVVVDHRHGAAANAAAVAFRGGTAIVVNNFYTLGSSRALDSERNQAVIPLAIHPDPRSVFFLGMGTGITAGASLAFPVESVVVCELIDDVVSLARRHFVPYVNGLFSDPRATISAQDGRTCLSRSRRRYDVIISDLFTPWEAGTGNLYTLEHYRLAAERLNPGGIYAQWIPLYQVSEKEFAIIARTMAEVFAEVTVWRGDLFPSRSIVALIGSVDGRPLDPGGLAERARATTGGSSFADRDDGFFEAQLLRFYAGSITAGGLFADAPINRDDRPWIEYRAPRTQRAVRANQARFLTGFERQRLYQQLRDATPPAVDPYLRLLNGRQLGYVSAGLEYTWYNLLVSSGRRDSAERHLSRYLRWIPPSVARRFSPAAILVPQPTALTVSAGPSGSE